MNLRKFYLVISIVMSIFLFFSGAAILVHINSLNDMEDLSGKPGNLVSDFLKPFVFGKDPVNFLVLVGDKSEANTDTMMLVNFNPSTDKLNILSIPRDTKVNVSGKIPKINSLFARKNGTKLLVDTVSELLNVNINYYVYLNISTFRKIIDLLGGVYITVPCNMDYDDPTQNLHIHLKKGRQPLDGKKAEQFLRFRHPNSYKDPEVKKYYDGSDIKRIEAQQYFMKELIKQKANIIYLPKLNSIINLVYDNLETNITLNEVTKIAKNITDFSADSVQMFTLPGNSRLIDGIWYYITAREEALKITLDNFSAKGDFSSYNHESSKSSNNADPAPQKDTSGSKDSAGKKINSVTKNNPSNGETSVKGSAKPGP